MASYELSAFDRQFQAISLVGAIEQQSPFTLNTGFWIRERQGETTKLGYFFGLVLCETACDNGVGWVDKPNVSYQSEK